MDVRTSYGITGNSWSDAVTDIDKKRLLRSLFLTGHFWNLAHPDGLNVDQSNVEKLDLSQRIAQDAVASWQAFDGNFSEFTRLFHHRSIHADGDVGPATAAMLDVSRCGIPDFAPPPNASFRYDDPGLQSAVESYQRYAEAGYVGGSGSWPRCDPLRQDCHSVVVAIDTSAASSHQKSIMDAVLRNVELTEAEIGQSVRHVRDGSFSRPHHNVRYENISGSVIGYAYFPTPDTCNQTVQARIDNTFNASVFVLSELLRHEYKGHSDGLGHTNGGIMNPSIGNPTKLASWKGDPSERTKTRYFGGVAIPNGPVEPPPPPPPPTDPPVDPPKPAPRITISGTGLDPAFGRVSGTFTAKCGESSQEFKVASAGGRNFKLVEKTSAVEPPKRKRVKK